MRFTTALLIASAGVASAQSSSTLATSTSSAASSSSSGSSDCQAQYIVDNCIQLEMPKVNDCGANDWVCLCENWTNVLTCYNNCPNSPDRNSALSSKTSYCQAAGPAMSSSSAALASRTATMAASSGAASATGTGTGSSSGSSSSSSASAAAASSSGAAAPLALPAGGVFAFLLGLAGML